MLGRYHMKRGKRAPDDPLPEGSRQGTRKHTEHPLRPEAEAVTTYLAAPSNAAWEAFAERYRSVVGERFPRNRAPFDAIAQAARDTDVWFGCSCPTKSNPDLRKCHTFLALEFFAERYPDLEIRWPV